MNALVTISIVLIVATIVVGVSTWRRGRWGINLEPVACPNCGEVQLRIRRPTSLRQAMWGGNTCRNCGCEMDKWGTAI
jgi:hypothetical protein